MPPEDTQTALSQQPTPKNRLRLSWDLRIIIILLLVVIGAMLFLWKPWDFSPKANDQTVSVTGEAIVKAEPDEHVFSPSYEFKNSDKQAALTAMSKKSDELVGGLKKLGVSDKDIKTNAADYARGVYFPEQVGSDATYTLNLTVTVASRELAQKVQDYLVGTTPSGAVSPQSTFSDAKRKQLESQARDEATKDARAKADQSAKNLGFKVSKVKAVTDGSGFGGIEPLQSGAVSSGATMVPAPKLSVQPGQNELSYSVTVVYYIK